MSTKSFAHKNVVVVGGGFAGMTAALQLAGQGLNVTLLEKEAAIGGFFPLLDNTFPTHSCGVCFLSPKQPAYCPFIECRLSRNLTLKTSSRPVSLAGEPGAFRLEVERVSGCVDPQKCIDCGKCVEVCPVEVPSEFSDGLENRKAIYKIFPKMVSGGYLLDSDNCNQCGACVEACPTRAIELGKSEIVKEELEADAVLLTPGFALEEGRIKGEYGFGRYANVVTARQMERMISFSGPTGGRPLTVVDRQVPQKIAFIQCVGSRDRSCGRGYCSSVCCMYATKQAMFVKQRSPETEVVVYYMDLRGVGKDYEKYFNRARNEFGIEYRRSMVSTVHEDPRSHRLNLVYDREGEFVEEAYDLVVLSLGFDAPKLDFAGDSGLELDDYGFVQTPEFAPGRTSISGVFAAGAFCGPKDIPESVLEAQAAAADLAVMLTPSAVDEEIEDSGPATGPDEGAVWSEEPCIGYFLCTCSGTFESEFDLAALAGGCKKLSHVACVETVDNLCTPEGLKGLRPFIGEHELNRIVLAACSVRELGRMVDDFAAEIGFNRNAFTIVNLREQVLFPMSGSPEAATGKALSLLRAAHAGIFRALPAPNQKNQLDPRTLVVGGGAAGMSAALTLAGYGYPVTLVEKEERLGGRLHQARYTLEGGDPGKLLSELVKQLEESDNVDILLSAEIVSHEGRPGAFRTVVRVGETDHLVSHGALVMATGAQEASTDEYLYGDQKQVLTQSELETRLNDDPGSLEDCHEIVMIQCVGSREENGREYCSRVCCTHALKNALKLKAIAPSVRITILYRDLRAYGLFEDYYRQAREAGIIFTPYEVDNKPVVGKTGDKISLNYFDQVLRRELTLTPDLLVLSTGIEAGDNDALARIFNLPLDAYGFFAEANSKAALVDFVGEGRYHCGLASAPAHFRETLVRARAAAGRAATFLGQKEIKSDKNTVEVSDRLCSGCGLCVSACPYEARSINPASMIAEIDYALCHGCGACAAVCPNGATQQIGFVKSQVMAMGSELIR